MSVSFPDQLRVDAAYKGFVVGTDQPVRLGGSGSAPAPFDYFLASIGTCAGFYVLSFLRQRGLPTQGVTLTLNTVKDPKRQMVSDITITICLPADFPEKYRRAIVNAVNLCPVKRHLETPPRFETIVQIGGRVAA